jgi:hypothetical protein
MAAPLLLLNAAATFAAAGQFLEFDRMFGDGAVLQMRPARPAVWGSAPVGAAGSTARLESWG